MGGVRRTDHLTNLVVGAIMPAGVALFITALVAGRSALTQPKAKVVGLVGVLCVAIVSVELGAFLIGPVIGAVVLGFILRSVFGK